MGNPFSSSSSSSSSRDSTPARAPSPPRPKAPLSTPWREIGKKGKPMIWNEETERELRDTCLKTDLGLKKKQRVKILMLGATGSGKSSFVNSLYDALKDKVNQWTYSAASATTVTKTLYSPPLKIGGKTPWFKILDAPGILETDEAFYTDFVKMALDGHIKEGKEKRRPPSDSVCRPAVARTSGEVAVCASHRPAPTPENLRLESGSTYQQWKYIFCPRLLLIFESTLEMGNSSSTPPPSPPAPPLEQPWRQIGKKGRQVAWNAEMEQALRDECLQADMELLDQRQVRILMLGATGSGKSSFINSLYSALTDRLKRYTYAEASDKTVTPFLHHPPLSVGGNAPYFRIQDTPGIMETDDKFYTDFVKFSLEGHMKEDVELSPGGIPRDANHYVNEPGLMDRPCLVVFVLGPKPLNPDSVLKRKLDIAKELARRNKIKLVIVATKADLISQSEAHPLKNADVQYIFRSEAVLEAVRQTNKNTKLPEGCIFPVTNYSQQTETCTEMNIVLLYTLSKLLDDAKLEADKRLKAKRL